MNFDTVDIDESLFPPQNYTVDLALQGPMAGRYYLTILHFAEFGCINKLPNNSSVDHSPVFVYCYSTITVFITVSTSMPWIPITEER